MAISGKYGKISISKIPDDEPVFILRAQDKLAEPAIEMYKLLAASHGARVVDSVSKDLESFKGWKGAQKMPD